MRTLLISSCLLMGSAGWRALQAQQLPQDPVGTLVAATPGYEFHIDFWPNLHDYVYWRAQEDGPSEEGEACLATRPGTDQAGWREAEAYYRAELKDRHWRRDPLMRAMRYTLSGLATQPDSVVAPVFEHLRAAASVYRACFWERHHTLARERVADLLPRLVTLGPTVQRRLGGYYEAPWPTGIHVDVVPYASFAGANTASGPDVSPHMQISSIDSDLADLSGLELLLHEASHEIFGIGRGLVGEAIDSVSRSLGVDPPRDLWHAMSFFTTGYVMQDAAGEVGIEYVPYWVRTGLLSRAWPDYLEPIQEHWPRYLRGEVGAEEAVQGVVSAIVR